MTQVAMRWSARLSRDGRRSWRRVPWCSACAFRWQLRAAVRDRDRASGVPMRGSGNSYLFSRTGALVRAVGGASSGSDPPGGGKERPMTIRTSLVDDPALVRTDIRMILSGSLDIDIIGEAGPVRTGVSQFREQ